jgi:hypothetical protein
MRQILPPPGMRLLRGRESVTPITKEIILEAVDRSVVDSVEAFVRFRSGFHGDTGMRDYLYYRLMTNLPDGGTFESSNGGGTLLVQAEWYTVLKYRKTGKTSSCGRFDLGIPEPDELELAFPRALVAMECGRNKKSVDLLRDCDAAKEHEGPEPADITKLAREISHNGLRYGYALEFYDDDPCEAEELIGSIRQWITGAEYDGLRIVVLACTAGRSPVCTFLPIAWETELRSNIGARLDGIQGLKCSRNRLAAPRSAAGSEGGSGNRVSKQSFLSSCSSEVRNINRSGGTTLSRPGETDIRRQYDDDQPTA